jgi:hypothetical protein
MKTTLDLPDDLLIKAKTLAAQRKTTLRAIVESALIRELRPASEMENPDPAKYELGPFGILRIKRQSGTKRTSSADIRRIQNALDEEDLQKALHPTRP